MEIKQILQNKWTKRIGISAILAIAIVKFVSSRNSTNLDSLKYESDDTSNESNLPNVPIATNTTGMYKYMGYSYSKNSLLIGKSVYEFTSNAVIKLQKALMSLSTGAKTIIVTTGGADGVIGQGFIKALDIYLKNSINRKVAMSKLFKKANLSTSEYTKK